LVEPLLCRHARRSVSATAETFVVLGPDTAWRWHEVYVWLVRFVLLTGRNYRRRAAFAPPLGLNVKASRLTAHSHAASFESQWVPPGVLSVGDKRLLEYLEYLECLVSLERRRHRREHGDYRCRSRGTPGSAGPPPQGGTWVRSCWGGAVPSVHLSVTRVQVDNDELEANVTTGDLEVREERGRRLRPRVAHLGPSLVTADKAWHRGPGECQLLVEVTGDRRLRGRAVLIRSDGGRWHYFQGAGKPFERTYRNSRRSCAAPSGKALCLGGLSDRIARTTRSEGAPLTTETERLTARSG
jgi:hypothetical protein